MQKPLVLVVLAALALAGCGAASNAAESAPNSESPRSLPPVGDKTPLPCREAQAMVRLDEAHFGTTYVREDRATAHKECNAAARARWARIQRGPTPAEEAQQARKEESKEAERVSKETG